MMIRLNNPLFQVDPDIRFSQRYGVPREMLDKLCGIKFEWWEPYEIVDYFNEVVSKKNSGKRLTPDVFLIWKKRLKVYLMTEPLRRKNTHQVPLEWFGIYKDFVAYQLYPKTYKRIKGKGQENMYSYSNEGPDTS